MKQPQLWKRVRVPVVVALVVLVLELGLGWLVARDDVLANIVSRQQYWWLGLVGLLVVCRLLLYFVLPPWLLWRVAALLLKPNESPTPAAPASS
ncbi:MAG TPA: hypothetical protein PKA88_07565 [Polyangiaceae bacterium]|nr:hypothetical protein [Polyangiaceae bacterium]